MDDTKQFSKKRKKAVCQYLISSFLLIFGEIKTFKFIPPKKKKEAFQGHLPQDKLKEQDLQSLLNTHYVPELHGCCLI